MSPCRVRGYELLELLRDNGPVTVRLARHEESGRVVVLETVEPSVFGSRGKADRWLMEARSLRKFNHPGLARVLDIGRGSVLYVVREWVPGVALAQMLGTGWAFDLPQSLRIAGSLAEAIAYLHRHGRAHGAICPRSVLIDTAGEVRLTGLGGMLTLEPEDAPFLAPEVLERSSPGKASDLYSLGKILAGMVGPEARWPLGNAARAAPVTDPLQALIHALTGQEPAARPHNTRAVAETLREMLQRLTPPPPPPPNEDEVLDLAQAVSDLGLPLTSYRAAPGERKRSTRLTPPPQTGSDVRALPTRPTAWSFVRRCMGGLGSKQESRSALP